MNTSKLLIGFLILILVNACYKDKGNYDYKNVNDFEVTVTPAPVNTETNIYLVNQPGLVADTFRLVAEGKQTLNSSEDNLEYIWYRTLSVEKKEISSDTIYGKENLMELPAAKKSEWRVLLVVRDKSMELEYYKSMTVKTKVPFYNSWLFVHGAKGERKLGALSWDEAGNAEVVPDIMEAMGQPGYPHMTNITYTCNGSENMSTDFERLFIISAPDSITYTFPFNSKVMGRYMQMGIPRSAKIREMHAPRLSGSPNLGLITMDGKLFYSTKYGTPAFMEASGNVASNYSIDKAYMNKEGEITMWDNTNKRLMYYIDGKLNYIGTIGAKDLFGKKALWLGRDAKAVDNAEPCLFIAKHENNAKCYLYHITYDDDKGGKMTKGDDGKEDGGKDEYALGVVTCDSTQNWGFTGNTLFAISDYFADQFFFTEGNTIYRGIMADGEKIKLYEATGTIKKMAFRCTNKATIPAYDINRRILSMVITNADGTDEIHEIQLSNGGDVEEKHVYDLGDVQVIDWSFSEVNRLPDL